MYKYKCLNPIAKFGLDHFTREYKEVEELEEAEKALDVDGLVEEAVSSIERVILDL